ncbi:hypothetical protein J4734_26180 [Klebsiella pneumoniae]|uniref:Uncharacterized protein n=1 Tax=Klebsiella pneumoniae TaxID=573 RepID=A0A939NTR2_KLEPN|nr:hypothetical protein [Klebsiella pneumoniae]
MCNVTRERFHKDTSDIPISYHLRVLNRMAVNESMKNFGMTAVLSRPLKSPEYTPAG